MGAVSSVGDSLSSVRKTPSSIAASMAGLESWEIFVGNGLSVDGDGNFDAVEAVHVGDRCFDTKLALAKLGIGDDVVIRVAETSSLVTRIIAADEIGAGSGDASGDKDEKRDVG